MHRTGLVERKSISDRMTVAAVCGRDTRGMKKKNQEEPKRPFSTDITTQPGDIEICADRQGAIVWWNEEAEAVLGYTRTEVLGLMLDKVLPHSGAGLDRARFSIEQVMNGRDFAGVFRSSCKDGSRVALSLYATAGRDDKGNVVGVVCIGRDISGFWQAERDARASEEKYRLLFNLSVDVVALVSKDGRIVEANRALARLSGYPKEELTGMPIIDLVIPEERERAGVAFGRLWKTKQLRTVLRFRTHADLVVVVELNVALLDVGGRRLAFAIGRDVTEREAAQSRVRDSEHKYHRIFSAVRDGIYLETLDGRILDANEGACRQLGYSRAELLQKTVADLMPQEAQKWLPRLRQTLVREKQFLGEGVNLRKDGTEIPVEISSSLVELGGESLVLALVRDISERRRADQALRESEENFRALAENANDGILIAVDPKRHDYVNRRVAEMTGYTEDELLQMGLEELAAPEEALRIRARWERRMRGESVPSTYETAIRSKTDERIPVEITAGLTQWRGEQANLVILRDIRWRKEAERALQESEYQYRTTINAMWTPAHVVDRDFRFTLVNDAMRRWNARLGLPVDVVGKNLFEIFPFLPEDKVRDEYWRVFETGEEVVTEEETRFGTNVHLTETRKSPIAESGKVARVLTVIHDTTERKKAERELKCLADTAMALVAVPPDIDAYDFVCEHLGPLVGDAVFSVSAYDEERHTLTVRRVVGLSDEQLASVREQTGTDLVGMTFERMPVGVRDHLARGKLDKIEDGLCGAFFHTIPEAICRTLAEHFNIGAAWSVGLRRKGRLFGNITIFGPVGVELNGGAIETMVSQISIALERRLAEQELRESEQRYRAISDTALDSIFTKDQERRYTSVNPAMEKLFGIPATALLGKTPEELFDADSAVVIREVDRRTLAGEMVSETRDLPFGSEVHTFHTIQVPLRDATGRVTGISGIVRDITSRKRAEQALRSSEERFRHLVELSPDGITVHQDGKVVMVNRAGARLMGYDEPEEMIGLSVMELIHPEDRKRVTERIRQALKEGRSAPLVEERFRRKYGSYVWVEAVNTPFEWNGRPAVQVIVRDIDQRRRLQEEVEKLAAHTRIMFENSPNGICAHSDGRVVLVNSTFVRLLGYDTADELIGCEIAGLVAPEERERMARYEQGMLSGGGAPADYVFKALCRDGSVVELENSVMSYKVMEQTFILNTVRPVSGRG